MRKSHPRTLLQSGDLPRDVSKYAPAQAAGLAPKDCWDDGRRWTVSRRVSGFFRAFVSVCDRCAGDPALVHLSEADAILRGHGCHGVDCRMRMALFAGEKRWRSVLSPARGRESGKDQKLGGTERLSEYFYSFDSSTTAAVQTICAGGGSFSGAATDFCNRGFAWTGPALRSGRDSCSGVRRRGAGFSDRAQPIVCAFGSWSAYRTVHCHASDIPRITGKRVELARQLGKLKLR
jgi:hypothetical protein